MTDTDKPSLTADDLAIRLRRTYNPDKPILVDTGDGIYKIDRIEEESHEIFIFLGATP